jgi:hypothetical protein
VSGGTVFPELRAAELKLETAAGTLNGIAGRVGTGHATAEDFARAVDDHEYAREEYRNWLSIVTGRPASLIERSLSL